MESCYNFKFTDRTYAAENELAVKSAPAAGAYVALATACLFFLWNQDAGLLGMIFFAYGFAGLRFYLAKNWPNWRQQGFSRRWNQLLLFSAWGSALFWGLISAQALVVLKADSPLRILPIVIIMGIVTAGVFAMGSGKILYRGFLFFCLAPLYIRAMLLHDLGNGIQVMCEILVPYVVYLLVMANIYYRKFSAEVARGELLANMMSAIPMAISARDLENNHRFIMINPTAQRLWGLRPMDIERTPKEVLPTDIAEKICIFDGQTKMKAGGIWKSGEYTVEIGNQRRTLQSTLVYMPESQIVLDFSEDLTEMKRAQTEIEQLRDLHFHASKMATLGEMAGGIAHEINNPLTIITGRTEQAMMAMTRDPISKELILSYHNKILETVQRISKIIRGLLAFARGGGHDPFRPISARQVVTDALEICRNRFRNKEVMLKIQEFEDFNIDCRGVQIVQCLVNLLSNSLEAVSNFSDRWVEVGAGQRNEFAEFYVMDSGSGIRNPEIREKLMQPFFTTKEAGKGVGLGLSVVKGIVESHRGSFFLNDHCPRTQFVIRLPLMQRYENQEQEQKIA